LIARKVNIAAVTTGWPARKAFRRGVFHRRFGRWSALAQYGFPFSLGPCATNVARFRALARRARFAAGIRRVFANTLMTLAWPFGAFSTALKTSTRMSHFERAPFRAPVLPNMYWLALRHSVPPLEYARYRFDDPVRRKDMHQYVYWNDLPALAALNAALGADNRDVQDKDRFAQICTANGFPHVPTLAVFVGGKQTYPAAPFIPDAPMLWCKALRLQGGAGGAKWLKDGEFYGNVQGTRIRADQLAAEFRQCDSLVQPFIENHSAIARVTNGALASLRIVTGMNERGEAEFVASLLALPQGTRNSSVAGILGSIDLGKGLIRKAAWPSGEPVVNHPDTGVPIAGVEIPFWQDSVHLVCRAHALAFPRFAFLGWDIALTQDGPLLIETNSGWGALFHQMLDGPLGHTAFSRLVSRYV
jgi:hypothetical protein